MSIAWRPLSGRWIIRAYCQGRNSQSPVAEVPRGSKRSRDGNSPRAINDTCRLPYPPSACGKGERAVLAHMKVHSSIEEKIPHEPVLLGPVLAGHRNLLGEVVVRALSEIVTGKKGHRRPQIRKVGLDRDVAEQGERATSAIATRTRRRIRNPDDSLHPRLDHVLIPFGEYGRLEHHRVGLHQSIDGSRSARERRRHPTFRNSPMEPPTPTIPVDINNVFILGLLGRIHPIVPQKVLLKAVAHGRVAALLRLARAWNVCIGPGTRGSSFGANGSSTLPEVKGTGEGREGRRCQRRPFMEAKYAKASLTFA